MHFEPADFNPLVSGCEASSNSDFLPSASVVMAAAKPLVQLLNQRPAYSVDATSIHFVASTDEWQRCVVRLRAAIVMGFDTETKPEFRAGRARNPCSLLQIAMRDARGAEDVFVLDLLALKPKLYNAALADIFLSKRVLKLGQGFYHDLQELALSYPSATCFHVAKRVVELNDISVALLGGGGHLPLSLQKLVLLYLDRKLTKTQQTSNWNRRPLAPSQLHYAAADALVLIHLYDELMKRMALSRSDFQVDSLANVLDVHVPPAPRCNLCFSSFASAPALKQHRKECVTVVHRLEVCASCDESTIETAEAMRQHLSKCTSSEVGSDDSSCVVVRMVMRKNEAVPAPATPARSRKRSPSTAAVAMETPSSASAKAKCIAVQQKPAKKAKQQPPSSRAQPQPEVKISESPPVSKKYAKRQRQKLSRAQAAAASEANATATKQQTLSEPDPTPPAAESKRVKKKRRQQQTRKLAAATSGQSARSSARKMSVESSLLASDAIWSQVSTDQSASMFSP
ncbi:hypothetical protein PybrP1_011872 [[Pythium] brassicae (nom. inval.)]|nr:hypothetical protein PybrP1_011872 [[Pythium] brassicae (nom. inval.)]